MARQKSTYELDESRWLGDAARVHPELPRATTLLEGARAALSPPLRMRLSQWADENFVLSAESSAVPGRWKCLPYQVGILDTMTDDVTRTITLLKSARVGFSLMASAGLAYYISAEPTSILVVQPTIEDARGFSRETLAPMFRDVPVLRTIKMSDDEATDSMMAKSFPGGVITLVGANSGSGLRRISRRIVFCDEVDAMPVSSGDDGDAVALATKRAAYFSNAKIIIGSTPLVSGLSRVEASFAEGDQRRFYVPCPQCGHMAFFTFSPRTDGRGHVMAFDTEGDERHAHFVCEKNGCVIEHRHKRQMLERGEWRADRPFKGHASFSIWEAYSLAPTSTWDSIADAFLTAKRRGQEHLRVFTNTVLGETYRETSELLDFERLYERREPWHYGELPVSSQDIVGLTCGVDVMHKYITYEVIAHGRNRETWSIDAGSLPMQIAVESDWHVLDALVGRTYRSTDGIAYPISCTAVDSGDSTADVYSWARTHGREVMVIKGNATQRTVLSSPSKADVKINGKRLARGLTLWSVGVSVLKGRVMSALQLPRGGGEAPAGYCHFGSDASLEFFRQLTSEVESTSRGKHGVTRAWTVIAGRQNHALDARVYGLAAAELLGFGRGVAPTKPRAAKTGAGEKSPEGEAKPAAPAAPAPRPAAPKPAAPATAPPGVSRPRGGWMSGGGVRRPGGRWI